MKLRFDDNYEEVFEYDKDLKAYIFIGSYFAFGIKNIMSKKEKIKKVEDELLF